jgi:outer membrane protein OmpA-like peptidoglycan-associated protein
MRRACRGKVARSMGFRAIPSLRCTALLGLSLALSTRAVADPKVDLQTFHPPATYSSYLGLDGTDTLPHLRGAAGLYLSDGHDALVLRDASGKLLKGGELVEHQLWLEALGSVGFFDRFEVGLAIPVALYQGGDDAPPGIDVASSLRGERGAALGDLRLDGKVLLVDHVFGHVPRGVTSKMMSPHRLRLALVVGLTFPTATKALAGDTNVTGRPRFALEYAYRRLRLVLDVGAVFRARSALLDLDVTHQFTWGLGARILLWRGLEILGEARGAVGVAPPPGAHIGIAEAPAEIDAGFSYRWRVDLHAFIAGGVGLGDGFGNPTYRVLIGFRYTAPERKRDLTWAEEDSDHDGILNQVDRCPNEPGPAENEGCPDLDSDSDGIIDRLDRCPDRAGVPINGGCPDYDTDGDNVPDRLDKCPNERGSPAFGGCPQLDTDKDGVPDTVDRCPDKPGPVENDGCPDIDSDGDGLVDRLDKCPFDAEVYNGVTDEDGCPDVGPELAAVTNGQITIFEPIVFIIDGGVEKPSGRSLKIIAAVGALLKAHTEIKRLRVDGHTDNRGGALLNLELSLKRAQSVRRVLVERWKIDPKRVTAQGFGPDRPLDDNTTEKGRARNRRIEFTILEVGP